MRLRRGLAGFISLSIVTPVEGMMPLVRRAAGLGGVALGADPELQTWGQAKCYTCARSLQAWSSSLRSGQRTRPCLYVRRSLVLLAEVFKTAQSSKLNPC